MCPSAPQRARLTGDSLGTSLGQSRRAGGQGHSSLSFEDARTPRSRQGEERTPSGGAGPEKETAPRSSSSTAGLRMKVARVTGLEPAASSVTGWRSKPTELHPRVLSLAREGGNHRRDDGAEGRGKAWQIVAGHAVHANRGGSAPDCRRVLRCTARSGSRDHRPTRWESVGKCRHCRVLRRSWARGSGADPTRLHRLALSSERFLKSAWAYGSLPPRTHERAEHLHPGSPRGVAHAHPNHATAHGTCPRAASSTPRWGRP